METPDVKNPILAAFLLFRPEMANFGNWPALDKALMIDQDHAHIHEVAQIYLGHVAAREFTEFCKLCEISRKYGRIYLDVIRLTDEVLEDNMNLETAARILEYLGGQPEHIALLHQRVENRRS